MNAGLLAARGLTLRFGAVTATADLSLDIHAGELHALIGPNGAGKTTALAQLSGELAPDRGQVLYAGRDITRLPVHARARLGIARSYQVVSVFPEFSVEDNLAIAVQAHAGHSFRFWAPARRDPALRARARAIAAQVGLGDVPDTPAVQLAHGQRRALEVALALAGGPRVLLLDEPMAGLGGADTAQMAELLRALRGRMAILLVEHDMDVVFALADRVTVMVGGSAIASGSVDEVRRDPEVRRAYLGAEA